MGGNKQIYTHTEAEIQRQVDFFNYHLRETVGILLDLWCDIDEL